MSRNYEKEEDILAHEGDDYERFLGAVVPPIFQNTLFVLPTAGNGIPEHPYVYSRVTNPTVEVVEKKLAALEHGEDALCFSSGMAAISSAIMHFVEKDCHVITVRSIYGPTRTLLKDYLPRKFGVETTLLCQEEAMHLEDYVRDNTRLIYLESPSSGVFSLQDLEYVGKLGRERGIGTVIDNTCATSLYQKPLDYGIDISVHTASKYLGGHSDIIAGALISSGQICGDPKERAGKFRRLYGSSPGVADAAGNAHLKASSGAARKKCAGGGKVSAGAAAGEAGLLSRAEGRGTEGADRKADEGFWRPFEFCDGRHGRAGGAFYGFSDLFSQGMLLGRIREPGLSL